MIVKHLKIILLSYCLLFVDHHPQGVGKQLYDDHVFFSVDNSRVIIPGYDQPEPDCSLSTLLTDIVNIDTQMFVDHHHYPKYVLIIPILIRDKLITLLIDCHLLIIYNKILS